MAGAILLIFQDESDYPLYSSEYDDTDDVDGAVADLDKRAWNSGFSGLGKRAWNSGKEIDKGTQVWD